MKIRFSMCNIELYFYIFFIIFGPKLLNVIDTSIIICLLIIFQSILYKIKIFKPIYWLLLSVLLLFTYSIIISLVNLHFNFIFIAKYIRVILAIVAIDILVSNRKYESKYIVNCIINILLFHALIVIVSSIIWIDLQNLLKWFTNFSLSANFYRSTGLTNGYDFSGVLCIFGLVLVSISQNKLDKFNLFKIAIFIIATFFTSRFNMLLLELTLIYLVFQNNQIKKIHKICLLILLFITIIPVLGIFLYSTGYKNNVIITTLQKNNFFSILLDKLIYYYANTDIIDTITAHFNFSELTDFELIFGAMKDVKADPGYTQYIYSVGIIGLIFTLSFYIQILFKCVVGKVNNQNLISKYYAQTIIFFILILLILSLKNSYLLARHVTEIILLLYTIYLKETINDGELKHGY